MTKARIICFVLTFFLFSNWAFAQQPATLALKESSPTVISKNIYGHFAEHLGRCIYDGFYKDGKIRMDVVEALKKIHTPVLR